MVENIFFTVINPYDEIDEERIEIEYEMDDLPENKTVISLGSESIVIDNQQLMELGTLFIAIAGNKVDFSSADGVLDGFSLAGKRAVKSVADALEE